MIETKNNIREGDRRKEQRIKKGKTERESDRIIKTKNNIRIEGRNKE